MRNRRARLTPAEQERLERFLEWRRVEGRGPRSRWRRIPHVAGAMVCGVIIALGAAFFLTSLTGPQDDTRQRVASAPEPVPPQASLDSSPAVTPSALSVATPLRERSRHGETSAPGLWESGTAGEVITMLNQPPTLPRRPAPEDRLPAGPESDAAPTLATAPAPPSIAPSETLPPPPALPGATPDRQQETLPLPPAPAAPSTPPSEPATAIAPTAPLPAVMPTPAAAKPPVPMPDVAAKPLPQPLETLKRWAAYAPEVRMGKAIIRWVKSQAPAESQPPQPEPRSPQTR